MYCVVSAENGPSASAVGAECDISASGVGGFASAGAPKVTKRGRKSGSKVPCAPWSVEDDMRLKMIVEAWDSSAGPKRLLWADAVQQLGSHRTVASVEQHWYYMERQQRAKATSPATCGANKMSSRVPAAAAEARAKAPTAVEAASAAPVAKRKKHPRNSSGEKLSFAGHCAPNGSEKLQTAGMEAIVGVARNTRTGPWGFAVMCPGCRTMEFLERGLVRSAAPPSERARDGNGQSYRFPPCHQTDADGLGMSVISCRSCGPFLVRHHQYLFWDENEECTAVECECDGCVEHDKIGLPEEGADEMRWLAKCDREGRCFECGEAHQGRAEPYWIPHPQDEDECIRDVLFCYRCYDGVRDDRRRGLGMSHGSDRDGRRDSDESGGDYWD